ncbi:MAG: helix-turn-helix transcriptional regulator [Clostridia bacterium]|nr:helix-turn-helix transcriptional regulator [Clostridia bacterium]
MLSERIKQARKQKGMSQEELAVRINVVRQTVSKYENGDSHS